MLMFLANLQNFRFETLRRDDRGVTAVEYALLLAFVAVALITALGLFSTALDGVFSTFSKMLP
jgi:Flp pilus assembly pilin Flp